MYGDYMKIVSLLWVDFIKIGRNHNLVPENQ